MSLKNVVNIEDLHQLAKKRLPKIAFDFIEGGVEDERALETNRAAFHKHQLLPLLPRRRLEARPVADDFRPQVQFAFRHLADRHGGPFPPRR